MPTDRRRSSGTAHMWPDCWNVTRIQPLVGDKFDPMSKAAVIYACIEAYVDIAFRKGNAKATKLFIK